ncbi:hypothetical protein [Butyrivibrio sp. FCS014]|uniref:hypothetical protein n=1 Tax=Butyrivibrio sp. FCS014 TaxID=1408304 RepID=UPI000688047F|nr:hypothetical protein [Butyrivibrio sp. FCS014]
MRAERNRKKHNLRHNTGSTYIVHGAFLYACSEFLQAYSRVLKNPFALPQSFNVDNFITAIDRMNFGKSLFNTAAITVTAVVVNMIVSAMTGYLFARRKWKINKIISWHFWHPWWLLFRYI